MICCTIHIFHVQPSEDSAQIRKASPKNFSQAPLSRNFGYVTSRFRYIHINWLERWKNQLGLPILFTDIWKIYFILNHQAGVCSLNWNFFLNWDRCNGYNKRLCSVTVAPFLIRLAENLIRELATQYFSWSGTWVTRLTGGCHISLYFII